jgi:hypothetical protein
MKLFRAQDASAAARRVTCNAAYELASSLQAVWRFVSTGGPAVTGQPMTVLMWHHRE